MRGVWGIGYVIGTQPGKRKGLYCAGTASCITALFTYHLILSSSPWTGANSRPEHADILEVHQVVNERGESQRRGVVQVDVSRGLDRHKHVEKCGLCCQKTLRNRCLHCSVSHQTHNKGGVLCTRHPAVALFFSKWSRVMMLKLPGSSQSPQTWANAHEFQSWKTSTVDFQALPAGKVDLGSTPYFFQSCRNAHWSGIPGG